MALDVDLVATTLVVLAAEEVVEADLVEAGRGLVRRDVPADLEALAVGARHHDRGVPADERADPALDVLVAGEPRLTLGRDRVDVVGAAQRRHADLHLAGPFEQAQHDVARSLASALVDERVEGVDPVVGLVRVDVGQLGGQALVDDGRDRGRSGGARTGGCVSGHSAIVARWGTPRIYRPVGSASPRPGPRPDLGSAGRGPASGGSGPAARRARRAAGGRGCAPAGTPMDYSHPSLL